MKLKFLKGGQPDYVFIGLLALIVTFGLVMLTSASSDLAREKFGDSYYYLAHQALYGLLPGLVGFMIGALLYYRQWEKYAMPLLCVGLFFLVVVFTPLGFHAKGGDRWVSVGAFSFQPAELLKLFFFMYLAAWISKSQIRGKSFKDGFFPFLILVGGVMLLLLLQPATTTAALIFGASVLTYFTAGARIRFLVASVLVVAVGLSVVIYFSPYRLSRVMTFLNPDRDVAGASYHINQALLAIGSGGITGVGFGKSTTKLHYLPEPIGDSIFAVIGEELGFIGAITFIFLFFSLIWRGMMIARKAPDGFSRLLVTGFISVMGLQAFVNIAAISGIMPLTGVPLPFVSYGGTALAVFLTMSGIVVNISRYSR